MFKQFLHVLIFCVVFFPAVYGATYDPLDPRHKEILELKGAFRTEITDRKTRLGTAYSSVAIVDLARERLEAGNFKPSDPDWSVIIRNVLLGYGYKSGVIDIDALDASARPTTADLEVLEKGHMISCAFLRARGMDVVVEILDVYTKSAPAPYIENYVNTLNHVAVNTPESVYAAVEGVASRLQALKNLSTYNAWSAHERFWAVSGVIDPNTLAKLRLDYTAHTGTSLGFLQNLSQKLEQTIRALNSAGVPAAGAIEDLVRQSQQILLTIAAGTPTGDKDYARLVAANAADWQTIRKALFLALSVTSNPDQADTYLSTIFNCAEFYPEKTEPDAIKSYYWKIQALAKSFSSLWNGLKAGQADVALNGGLRQVVTNADPLIFVRNSSYPGWTYQDGETKNFIKNAYEEAVVIVDVRMARNEIAPSLALHPRLNFIQTFQTLYPELMAWTEYHTPSQQAQDLVGVVRSTLVMPAGVKPQRVHLVYATGKWTLKAIQDGREYNLWTQGAAAAAEFVGELKDERGVHLFSFRVNGASSSIKAISSSYLLSVGGNGAQISVNHGAELGLIESSAYPLQVILDPWDDMNNATILINGASYSGVRGLLEAKRGSVVSTASHSMLSYTSAPEIKQHKGKDYNFFAQQGHGITAHKDIMLVGREVNVSRSQLLAGQSVCLDMDRVADKGIFETHGSYIQAGEEIILTGGDWRGDTQTVFAGDVEERSHLVPNSARSAFHYGRMLRYSIRRIEFLNDEERDALSRGAHVHGHYQQFHITMPNFRPIFVFSEPVILKDRRPVRSIFVDAQRPSQGGGGVGKSVGSIMGVTGPGGSAENFINQHHIPISAAPASFGPFFQGGDLPNMSGTSLPNMARSMIPSGVTQQNLTVGITKREGNTSGFAEGEFDSGKDKLKQRAEYTRGEDGSSLSASTAYSGGEQGTSKLRDIHLLTGAAILQLTNSYSGKMSIRNDRDILTLGNAELPYMVGHGRGGGVPSVIQGIIKAGGFLKEIGEKAAEKAEEMSSSSNAKSGGPMGDPDDEDPEKKQTEIEQGKSQAPKASKPNSIYEQIGDDGNVKSRTFYDENGRMFSRQDFEGSKPHNEMLPHEHVQRFDAEGKPITSKKVQALPEGYTNISNK